MFANHLLQLSQKCTQQVDELKELCSKTHPYGSGDLVVSALRQLKIATGVGACVFNHQFFNSRVYVLGVRTLGHGAYSREDFQDSVSLISSDDRLTSEHDDMCPIDLDHGFEQIFVRFQAGDKLLSLSSGGAKSGGSIQQ